MLRRIFQRSVHLPCMLRRTPAAPCSKYSSDVSALLDLKDIGKEKSVKGWVKSVQNFGEFQFLHILDGTSCQSLQIVADRSIIPSKIEYGSCVSVTGKLVQSPAKGQPTELQATKVTLIGSCDSSDYPFDFKERHSFDQARMFPHFRPRTKKFGSLLRIRNAATMAVHNYFQNNGFCLINTPIITSSDCEGAGEVFEVKSSQSLPSENAHSKTNAQHCTKHFFAHPAFLTVSGQLHLETVTGAFKKAYTFGPTFRADNSQTRHHLSEFYMIEAEIAFMDTLDELMQVSITAPITYQLIMEDLIKFTTESVLSTSSSDIGILLDANSSRHEASVEKILRSKFLRMSYDDAVLLLEKNNENFQFKVSWGCDLQKEHEKYLVFINDSQPVFVTDFPCKLKPFYARENDDEKTSASVDLLFPDVGEMFGGTLREDRYDILEEKLQKLGKTEDYKWYLDIRKYGGCPHGGFGLGFERFLQWLLDIKNIRDVIPFPRSVQNCKL